MNFLSAITTLLTLGLVASDPLATSTDGSDGTQNANHGTLMMSRRAQQASSLLKCSGVDEKVQIKIRTDKYGFETSWELRNSESEMISRVPPSTYGSNKDYEVSLCIEHGVYTLIVRDIWGDGLCCNNGEGYVKVLHETNGDWVEVASVTKFASQTSNSFVVDQSRSQLASLSNDSVRANLPFNLDPSRPTNRPTRRPRRRRTQRPTRQPTPTPTKYPTPNPTNQPSPSPTKNVHVDPAIRENLTREKCNSSQRRVKIEILTDKYGEDTSWDVTDSQGKVIIASNKVYGGHEHDVREFCLDDGSSYDFVLRDKVGDGMCCMSGNGFYKVMLEDGQSWIEIFGGGNFKKKQIVHSISLKERTLTDRDEEWLVAHNTRRKEWHEAHGTTYVPLKWSEALKSDSKIWAEKLLDSCGKGMYHDPNNSFGENVAGNTGTGSFGMQQSADKIVYRFVEREMNWPWPKNSHLTQVLWRASKYVGCAEASRPYGERGMCHTQVCRYTRPGNCNMQKYKKAAAPGDGDWWLEPMLLDETQCGQECPPDGCY